MTWPTFEVKAANSGRSGSKIDGKAHEEKVGLFYHMNSLNINYRELPVKETLPHLVLGQAVLRIMNMM